MADTETWIVGNGDATKWRVIRNGWWYWTPHRGHATRYPTRIAAETAHEEDEDAWLLEQYRG